MEEESLKGLKNRLPSPAMLLAFVALFAALGGGAYAASVKLKANSVKTKNIKAGAVTESKIADGAVTQKKIAAGVIPAAASAPITAFGQNTTFSTTSVLPAAVDTVVAQLSGNPTGTATGASFSGALNTTSFTTPNHVIVVNFSSNVFPSGGATHVHCKLQQSVNGGGFADALPGLGAVDGAANAPVGGSDDHQLAFTTTIKGPKANVDLRVVCDSFNNTAGATYNNLNAVAYPSS
jgi:hypothetical protein